MISVDEISTLIEEASLAGIRQCLQLSGVAAATGAGASLLATAALVEITAFIIATTVGIFGLRSIPRKKREALAAVHESLMSICKNIVELVSRHVEEHIEGGFGPLRREIENRLAHAKEERENLGVCLEMVTSLIEGQVREVEEKLSKISADF